MEANAPYSNITGTGTSNKTNIKVFNKKFATPSSGWWKKVVMVSTVLSEWWSLCNFHKTEILWNNQWVKYPAKSINKKEITTLKYLGTDKCERLKISNGAKKLTNKRTVKAFNSQVKNSPMPSSMNIETSLFVRSESEEWSFSKAIKAKGNATRVIGKNFSNKAFTPFLNHLILYIVVWYFDYFDYISANIFRYSNNYKH